MSFFYKMNRLESTPFASEFISDAKRNVGLDTTYSVPGTNLVMENIFKKIPYDTRAILQGLIDNFGVKQLEENMELNLVNGYVMDIFMKSRRTIPSFIWCISTTVAKKTKPYATS